MTVEELINQLGFMDPTAEVHFSYNYGDHWRTQVAPTVDSVYEGHVCHSEYHRMDKLVDDEDDIYLEDGSRDEKIKQVVILG